MLMLCAMLMTNIPLYKDILQNIYQTSGRYSVAYSEWKMFHQDRSKSQMGGRTLKKGILN